MRLLRLICGIIILVCLFTGVALAQDGDTPPATPDAVEASEDAPPGNDLAAIQEAVATAQAAAAEAGQSAESAAESVGAAEDRVGRAFDLLGLFEAIAFLVTVVGGVAAILGASRLFSAQNELVESRKRFEEEIEASRKRIEDDAKTKEEDFTKLRSELQRDTSNATLALSFLPLGEGQYKSGDFIGALAIYRRALELDKFNPIINYRIGYVLTQSGQLQEAEEFLLKALDIEKDFAPALATLGYVYRRRGEKMEEGIERMDTLNKAEHNLVRALELQPKLVDEEGESWWGSLGGLYRRRDQVDQAIFAYTRAAEVMPNSSYAFSNLALLYMQKHNRERMLETYIQVEKLASAEVQADVDNYWAYADLLTSRLALNKIDLAKMTLDDIFTTVPEDSPYVLEALLDTLNRLSGVLEDEQATVVRDYIKRISTFAKQRAKRREEAEKQAAISAESGEAEPVAGD